MDKIFEGLKGYESVLLVLGVVLFSVSIVGMIVYVSRKQSLKVWLFFLVVSMAMVGFPGIKSISIGGDIANLETRSLKIKNGTATPQDVTALQESVNRLRDLPLSQKTSLSLARSQAVLGDTAAARSTTEQVLQTAPENAEARDLLTRLNR